MSRGRWACWAGPANPHINRVYCNRYFTHRGTLSSSRHIIQVGLDREYGPGRGRSCEVLLEGSLLEDYSGCILLRLPDFVHLSRVGLVQFGVHALYFCLEIHLSLKGTNLHCCQIANLDDCFVERGPRQTYIAFPKRYLCHDWVLKSYTRGVLKFSVAMSVLLETSLGDLVIDLFVENSPKACEKQEIPDEHFSYY